MILLYGPVTLPLLCRFRMLGEIKGHKWCPYTSRQSGWTILRQDLRDRLEHAKEISKGEAAMLLFEGGNSEACPGWKRNLSENTWIVIILTTLMFILPAIDLAVASFLGFNEGIPAGQVMDGLGIFGKIAAIIMLLQFIISVMTWGIVLLVTAISVMFSR